MASYPSIEFPNNIIPEVFNKSSFVSKALKSDDILTSSLNVLGPSTLNTVQSGSINNTSNLTSNSITCTADLTSGSIVNSGSISSASISNSGLLTSNTITCASTLTASNGFVVSAGTVSLPANSLTNTAINGLGTRLAKLDNLTGSVAVVSTITSNVLTINYTSNNGQTIFVTPTANFSLVLTNVQTSAVQAIYKLEIYITGKFYCTGITVNGTSLTMVAVGGMANIATQVNASATVLIQNFKIFFTGTSTPSRIITELKSTW
jgi:adhesin HecA-like repeat protein